MQTPEYQSQLLSLALKGAKSGIWDWHIPEDRFFFGPNYYRIAGYEPNEFPHTYKEWEKRVHVDDIATVKRAIQKYIAGETESYTVEYRFRTKAGSWMWILGQGEITKRDNEGKPTRFTGLHIDISQSKKAEKAYEQERSFSTSLINTAQMIVLILDVDGRIRRINPYLEEITGYTEAEVKGKDWFDTFLPAADNTNAREVFKRAVNNIEVRGLINSITTKAGQELTIEWYNKTLKNTDGIVFGILSLGIDITARKQAEQKNIAYQEQLITILNSIDANVYVADMETYEILFMNKNMIQELGQDMTGKTCWEALWKKSGPCEFCTNHLLVNDSGQSTGAHVWNNQNPINGNHYINHDRAIQWSDGRQVHLQIATDISEIKSMEQQLSLKHKMEAVGYMAGGIAHNFNNNLSIILGNLELSQIKLPKDSDIAPLLENAKIAVRRSRDLILKIISYSRKGVQNKAPMQLLTIIDETITLLNSTLPATINLKKGAGSACESTFIHGDASQIQEVLINLCNNAVHAMNEKGTLTISLQPVVLSRKDIPAQFEAPPGAYAQLSFEDTGCGIESEIINKIFDPFFTTKEDYEGAGMGLATVQGIVAQHGGVIKVNSTPGQGTTFDLFFPIIDKAIIESNLVEERKPDGAEKILFIDDNEMLAKLWDKLLSEMGYQVSIMTESPEALKLFTANPNHFDLVITDQTMPDLTGEELIQKLKKIRPDLRTILCTGYSSQVDEDQARQQGIDAFCMKPLDLPQLLQTVRRVLDS